MCIREMGISDYDKVYALWLSCKGMGLNDIDDSKEGIGRFLERNPGTCFVAEEGNELLGAIMSGNDGRRGYIYHTAVSPDYRRKGIARALVNAALAALRALGISKTAMVVFGKNSEGNAFWESMGFTVRNDLVYRNRALTEMIRIDT